ncbi:MAG: GatB/YqeY domain-containing protein [Gammaproteobacteria bacterium]|nr:GatB/YqeY domain-containing protein [Gammaproteobacteria bacterium]
MASEIKQKIDAQVKEAMRARDKQRLGTLRLIMAEFKKVEVDERIELDDTRVLAILDKMLKQRKDSISQYQSAGRQDLVDQESFEVAVIEAFMPDQLDESEVLNLIQKALATTGASEMKDMGKVMTELRPALQGRADMGAVSALVKKQLG